MCHAKYQAGRRQRGMVKYVIDKAKEVTDIHVLPIAAITAGQDGEFITDFENLYKTVRLRSAKTASQL